MYDTLVRNIFTAIRNKYEELSADCIPPTPASREVVDQQSAAHPKSDQWGQGVNIATHNLDTRMDRSLVAVVS